MQTLSDRRARSLHDRGPVISSPAHKGGLRRLGAFLLTVSFLSISWNAVRVGGVLSGQVLLALAVAALGLDALSARRALHIPIGMVIGAIVIAVAGLLSAVLPVSAQYLNSRFNLSLVEPGPLTSTAFTGVGNLTQLAKFEVALILVPAAVALLRPSIAEVRTLASAWAISVVVSALVAVSDATGHTSINANLLGSIDLSGRQSGLTQQPNHLAVAMALATPVLLYWLTNRRKATKVAGVLGLALFAYGSLLTGSRGGFLGLLVGVGLFAVLTIRVQRAALYVLVAALGVAAVAVVFPSVLATVVTAIRIEGQLAAGSDALHLAALQQGLSDVQQSPIFGIGFDHLTDATEVHLQLLAAGGVTALVGYLVYWATVLREGRIGRHVDGALASALLAASLTFMFLNFIENQIADTYIYVPAAILVSLVPLQGGGRGIPLAPSPHAVTARPPARRRLSGQPLGRDNGPQR